MTVSADDLLAATQRLRARPADYGAWLEVAAILDALGERDDAEAAFAAICEGARSGGKVALAVACARHLAKSGSERGSELIESIVDTYSTGGPHFSHAALPLADLERGGPRPPGGDDEAPAGPPASGTPVEQARALIAHLGKWLAARRPATVPPAPLLSALGKPGARALVGVMVARAYPAGAIIIEMGEPATALYWLAHGTASVSRPRVIDSGPQGPSELGELHSGAFFGEIALVGGTTRTARVTAREDVWVLEIPARAVEKAAQKHPQLAEVLAFHARARLLSNLTRTSELFRALGERDRDELLAKFATELVAAGDTFIAEGQKNDHLWVVVSGKCEVRAAGGMVAELGPGAAVGEISLVSGAPAVADVVAVEPAVLLRLAKKDFDVVAKRHPKLLAEVEKLVVSREKQNRALFQDASDLIV